MSLKSSVTVGIDVGGTFTDLLAIDTDSNEVRLAKVPTTVDNQAIGFMAALAAASLDPAVLQAVVHGTTTTTNALLERKIARVGLITTKGFRDVLELGRRTRPQPYGLRGTFVPVIDREVRLEVPERMDADGKVLTPLDEAAVAEAAKKLLAAGCEAVVIHFLHSYINSTHERRAAEIVRALWPNKYVTAGHAILSEYREYERGVTAAVNASVQPVLDRYLSRLRTELSAKGFDRDLLVMQGNGGTISSQLIAEAAVNTVMSGPASGVMAAAYTGRASGHPDLITYDMGGTSTDVGLIEDAVPQVSGELELEYAMPIHVPMVDVHTIGAGGGSIASVDAAGMLRVGPESAGARPGPICYGRGGTESTVTDADLTLGYLNADFFLGGAMKIDAVATSAAFGKLAGALGVEPGRAAFGVHDVVNENMAGAARVAIAERGRVPSEYALLATGGAGPVHAWHVARKLGVSRVVCPPGAGAGSTIGMLMAPARVDRVASFTTALAGADLAAAGRIFAGLEKESLDLLHLTGADVAGRTVRRLADMRYIGQGSEITVVLPDSLNAESVKTAFEAAYKALFARVPPGAAIQFVALRLSVSAPMPGSGGSLELPRHPSASARKGTRPVFFPDAGKTLATQVWDRYALEPGVAIEGPAVFEENESTFIVGPNATARLLPDGSILAEAV